MTDGNKMDKAKEALRRDLEQTKSDLPGLQGEDLDQDATDTVRQALGHEDIPPADQPNPA